MLKTIMIAGAAALIATSASANNIITFACDVASDASSTTINVLVAGTPTSNAVIHLNGTAQTGVHTVNGSGVSVTATGEVSCGAATITVVDGSTTYTQQ